MLRCLFLFGGCGLCNYALTGFLPFCCNSNDGRGGRGGGEGGDREGEGVNGRGERE